MSYKRGERAAMHGGIVEFTTTNQIISFNVILANRSITLFMVGYSYTINNAIQCRF
jgi:hypothetical protein